MALEPVLGKEGLWADPTWNGQSPATFAVVIGVSHFDHLGGGAAPVPETYELGQLHTAALTAQRFFRWLCDDYRLTDRPLVKCWLALAPTPAELPLMTGPQHYSPATFVGCERIIGEWFTAMSNLKATHADSSRAIFFYSGHGLEVGTDKQILLPSDYLVPPLSNPERALSTYNLYAGLRALPIAEQFFFLDACRNDAVRLRELSLQGMRILPEWPSYRSRPDLIAPLVYATGSGAVAWEPTDPQLGSSLFGRALLEGLTAQGLDPDCDETACWIGVFNLARFLNQRVRQLLQANGARIPQPIRLGGAVGDANITQVPHAGPPPGAPPAGPPPAPSSLSTVAPTGPGGGAADAVLGDVTLPSGWSHPIQSASTSDLYDILRSEFVTSMLSNLRVFNLESRQWSAEPGSLDPGSFAILRLARTNDRGVYEIELQATNNNAQWLELSDGNSSFGFVLPSDLEVAPLYLLELHIERPANTGPRLTYVDLRLARNNSSPPLSLASELWDKYRAADIKAATDGDRQLMTEALLGVKFRSPLAATLGGLLLLRAWHKGIPLDWLNNLAEYFPDRPDGIVLWVEQCMRTAPDELRPAIDRLRELHQRGLPHTSEALQYAARQVHEVLSFELVQAYPDEEQRAAAAAELEELQQRLEVAMRVLGQSSCFAVFVGSPAAISPELILPSTEALREPAPA